MKLWVFRSYSDGTWFMPYLKEIVIYAETEEEATRLMIEWRKKNGFRDNPTPFSPEEIEIKKGVVWTLVGSDY